MKADRCFLVLMSCWFGLFDTVFSTSFSMTASHHPVPSSELRNVSSIIPENQVSEISSPLTKPKQSITFRGMLAAGAEISTFLFKARKFPRIIKKAYELRQQLTNINPDKYGFEKWPVPFYQEHSVVQWLMSPPTAFWLIPLPFMPAVGKYLLEKFFWAGEHFNAVEFPLLEGNSEIPKRQFKGSTFISEEEFMILKEFKALALEIEDIVPEGCPSAARGGVSVCKLNPIYDQIIGLRARAKGYLERFL